MDRDLVDIWRIRNPTDMRFTWCQKSPIIQRRLDFWLISDALQEDVEAADIIPSPKSDHSAITLSFNGVDDSKRGPSFWKFNSTLVNDKEYCNLLDTNLKNWLEEFKEVVDKRVLWDLLKYKIRQFTIDYSKSKARIRRAKLNEIEDKLRRCSEKCDSDPSTQNVEELVKSVYKLNMAIIRSRATWYEKGEKNSKYFLNLEQSNNKKSCVRKIFKSDETVTSNPKSILNELEHFYSNLYKESSSDLSETNLSSFRDDTIEVPTLSGEFRSVCEGKITHNECFSAQQSFPKNKTPGNDGLTSEFYSAFWSLIGKHLIDCISYSYEFGELSNSQNKP